MQNRKQIYMQSVAQRFLLFSFLLYMLNPAVYLVAQEVLTAYTRSDSGLYAEPDLYSQLLSTVPAETALIVEARDETPQWLLVHTEDMVYRGWLAMGHLNTPESFNPYEFPISVERFAEPLAPAQTYSEDVAAKIEALATIPLLYNMETEELDTIFAHGQEIGNRSDVFIKIGDSNTANGDFFRPMGMSSGSYCDYGAYQYLAETVDYFSVAPRSGAANSFDSDNFTVIRGLTAAALLDPLWAADSSCQANESPLACEQRVVRPSFSVMMIGLMDLETYDVETFETFLDEVIAESVTAGVIPIQTTFTVLPDYISPEMPLWEKSLDLNLVMIEVAQRYGTPVIHLWKALQSLPDYGIGPDRTHLRASVGEYCSFTGAELEYGGTMRTY
jgi:hypothetical protein